MNAVILCASPRPDGNSHALAESCADGVRAAGHSAELVELNEVLSGLLRDCRSCRRPNGDCSIDDGYSQLIHEQLLPADAWIYATPLYYYGMAASLKNFFDRLVCYSSASYPQYEAVAAGIRDKRSALLLSAEESNQAAGQAIVGQIQEISRYFRHSFVGVVTGIGNRRGEVQFDPSDPLGAARALGTALFTVHHSDYNMDSERSNAVWPEARGESEGTGIYEDV